MSSEERKIAKITGEIIKLNKKKVKGSELTLFLVARNEHGAEVEFPLGAEERLILKVKTSGGMKQIHQYTGNLQVKANHIETVIAQAGVQVNSRTIHNLIANQTTLGSTQEIGTCFAGCIGAHVNNQQRKITVRKSSRNPFEEDAPLEIGERLRGAIEKFQELTGKDKS
jgi:hypothetical protein